MAEDDGFKKVTRKDHRQSREDEPVENGLEEEEPDFSDSEDFIDDVTEDGNNDFQCSFHNPIWLAYMRTPGAHSLPRLAQ